MIQTEVIQKNNKYPSENIGDFLTSSNQSQSIRCSNSDCPYHDKAGWCSSPSMVEITKSGMCKPFLESHGMSKHRDNPLDFFKEI